MLSREAILWWLVVSPKHEEEVVGEDDGEKSYPWEKICLRKSLGEDWHDVILRKLNSPLIYIHMVGFDNF